MTRRNGYLLKWDKDIEELLRSSEILGVGNNGIVYMLPDNKVLKVFSESKVCHDECYILQRASKKSKHFPKVYKYSDNYIVREFVGGHRLDKYLKDNPLNKELALNLILLIKEFKTLGFKKLDIRCKDLYVQDDMTLMVIDPKQNYKKKVPYPRHLMKGLHKKDCLEFFLSCVKEYDLDLYFLWSSRMRLYLTHNIK